MLYRLMYYALIEMRAAADTCKSPAVYHLSDLLHTLPLASERMERKEITAEEVLQALQLRARQKGVEEWLEHRIQQELGRGALRDPGGALSPCGGRRARSRSNLLVAAAVPASD